MCSKWRRALRLRRDIHFLEAQAAPIRRWWTSSRSSAIQALGLRVFAGHFEMSRGDFALIAQQMLRQVPDPPLLATPAAAEPVQLALAA